jgi:hypothetical protein
LRKLRFVVHELNSELFDSAHAGVAHHGDTSLQDQASADGRTSWTQKDADEQLQFDPEENVYSQLMTANDDNDKLPFGMSAVPHQPLRQPESRRASTGLRLIGLGKRPSGSAGGSSPLKYIGLGRKRTSAIKYIGLGRRSGNANSEQGSPESLESDAYEATLNGNRFQGAQRQRRDVAMRLIGLGRRSDYQQLHDNLNSMSSFDDDADDFSDEAEALRNAANAAVARQQWHQVKRRAGGSDGTGLRRMQLRRWSSTSSSAGSHVDPALLMMGIGK